MSSSKPRLPTDVSFLLESVMSETPDKITFFADDVAKLKAAGKMNVKVGGLNWDRKDTLTFFVHSDANVIPYSTAIHTEVEIMLQKAAEHAFLNPNDFNQAYTSYTDDTGNVSFSKIGGKDAIGLYGLADDYNNPGIAVRRYLRNYVRYFRSFTIRGTQQDTKERIERAHVTAGRIWRKKEVVSFWNDKDTVMHHMKLIFGFMGSLKVNKKLCAYEFLDTRGFFTYKELFEKSNDKEKLSAAEIDALMRVQHVDPKAKEKLASPEFKDAMLKKAGRGFDNAAAANMAMPAVEETIKLKSLLHRR